VKAQRHERLALPHPVLDLLLVCQSVADVGRLTYKGVDDETVQQSKTAVVWDDAKGNTGPLGGLPGVVEAVPGEWELSDFGRAFLTCVDNQAILDLFPLAQEGNARSSIGTARESV
jgi:hypothetical protein